MKFTSIAYLVFVTLLFSFTASASSYSDAATTGTSLDRGQLGDSGPTRVTNLTGKIYTGTSEAGVPIKQTSLLPGDTSHAAIAFTSISQRFSAPNFATYGVGYTLEFSVAFSHSITGFYDLGGEESEIVDGIFLAARIQ